MCVYVSICKNLVFKKYLLKCIYSMCSVYSMYIKYVFMYVFKYVCLYVCMNLLQVLELGDGRIGLSNLLVHAAHADRQLRQLDRRLVHQVH